MSTLHELKPSLVLRADPKFRRTHRATLDEIVRRSLLTGQRVNEVRHLYVDDLNLSDVGALSQFTRLEKLFIAIQSAVVIPPLSGLKALRTVYLKVACGVDISPFTLAPNIDDLSLAVDRDFDFKQLEGFPPLRRLRIRYSNRPATNQDISDPLAGTNWLQRHTDLRTLFINDTICHSLRGINQLSELEELSVFDVNLPDLCELEGCRLLRTLSFGLEQPSDLSVLATLANLESLFICGDLQNLRLDPIARNERIREVKILSSPCPDLSPIIASPFPRKLTAFKSSLPKDALRDLRSARHITTIFPK